MGRTHEASVGLPAIRQTSHICHSTQTRLPRCSPRLRITVPLGHKTAAAQSLGKRVQPTSPSPNTTSRVTQSATSTWQISFFRSLINGTPKIRSTVLLGPSVCAYMWRTHNSSTVADSALLGGVNGRDVGLALGHPSIALGICCPARRAPALPTRCRSHHDYSRIALIIYTNRPCGLSSTCAAALAALPGLTAA